MSVTVDGGRTLTLVAHCKETNMDGFSTYDMGTVKGSYLCWLWNPAQGQFTAGPALCGYAVEPDPETRQVSVSSRGGWGTYNTDIYVPDEKGTLVHVKNIHEEPAADGSGTPETTVRELMDRQWVEASQ